MIWKLFISLKKGKKHSDNHRDMLGGTVTV